MATQGHLELVGVLHNVINMHVSSFLHTHHCVAGRAVLFRQNQMRKKTLCLLTLIENAEVCWASLQGTNVENHPQKPAAK